TNFGSMSALDAAFPAGTYYITNYAVHDGVKTNSFNLAAGSYPNAPQISNFAALQSVNPSNAVTVSWLPFTNGTAADFIIVTVSAASDLFQTPLPGQPGALPGTATSVTIPTNTLPTGQTNSVEVIFVKTIGSDTNGYPGVYALAAYVEETS